MKGRTDVLTDNRTKNMKYFIPLLIFSLFSCSEEKKTTETDSNKNGIEDPYTPEAFLGKHKAKVTVLGTFHFDNPGMDSYKHQFPFDILMEKRQKELNDLLSALEEYNPTKIMVEISRITGDSILNRNYQEYLKGNFDISEKRSETFQIAFKLAERLGHKKIYATDTERLKWFGADMTDDYDEEQYLKSLGQWEKFNRYDYFGASRFQDSLKSVLPLKRHLSFLNAPTNRLKNHQGYLTELVLVGAGDLYNGADATARWYQRNLRIFSNTYDFIDLNQEERVLLIYGSGHVYTLKQFFQDSPDFEYVEINDYLNNHTE